MTEEDVFGVEGIVDNNGMVSRGMQGDRKARGRMMYYKARRRCGKGRVRQKVE
jgi:hypothetical protein